MGRGEVSKSVIDDINNPTKRLPINSTKLGGRFFRGKATLRFSTFQKKHYETHQENVLTGK